MTIADAIKNEMAVERIYLFGSYATGAQNEYSDYDIFVLLPDDALRPLDAAMKAQRALSDIECRTPVDIVADYRSRFDERKLLNTLERKVWNEGVVLYERV